MLQYSVDRLQFNYQINLNDNYKKSGEEGCNKKNINPKYRIGKRNKMFCFKNEKMQKQKLLYGLW